MKTILTKAHMVDVTDTEDQARTERVIARKTLVKCLHEAEEIREKELKSRTEDYSALGDDKATLSYENLIEHEKSRSQWRKIQHFLKRGITELLTRLLYQDSIEGPAKIATDGEDIQNKIIDQNIKQFSTVEDSPLGKGSFLFEAISPHGTSDFCDRVLDGGLSPTDKEEMNFTEAMNFYSTWKERKYLLNYRPLTNGSKTALVICSGLQKTIPTATPMMRNPSPAILWTRLIHLHNRKFPWRFQEKRYGKDLSYERRVSRRLPPEDI